MEGSEAQYTLGGGLRIPSERLERATRATSKAIEEC